MCDMFGAKCFDLIMSDETHYKNCSSQCLDNCESISYIAHPSYVPINVAEICRVPLFKDLFKHLTKNVYFEIHGFEKMTIGKWHLLLTS